MKSEEFATLHVIRQAARGRNAYRIETRGAGGDVWAGPWGSSMMDAVLAWVAASRLDQLEFVAAGALRLQIGPVGMVRGVDGSRHPVSMGGRYRASRANGWHCGHWHRTPEDAVACAIAKGAPMD